MSYLTFFKLIHERKYHKAELSLINTIENILSTIKKNGISKKPILDFCKAIYFDFNENYLDWIKTTGGCAKEEIDKLHSIKHDNYLIAHCRDSACIDDLLYEIITMITETEEQKNLKDLKYNLDCYRRLFC
ncbi:MAG: hypothetical protein US11_C0001G0002 [Candidatus Roizmanbacteria bacterium GW2011_GWA2_36_23]|uniref:Uncharacterized protein n=1 Tax=Candidatus Roizmanbacteria bacterium GW2011_GWA2_36_23 TaxID=1618480 RepID=A0A0G0E574_9BACT|nr:MAG: hypothetical protein US11_C0001G0002 [Candidatus Roizmanbacteria bacterium GW2011_GWA2_36_23]